MATTKKSTTATEKKDRFGTRTGTKCATINSVLTGTPQTPQQVAEAIGDDAGIGLSLIRNHLFTLKKKGLIEKVGDGYKVAGATKPARRRKARK
ncbi:MAG: hypothetical protein CMJ47_13350 [Planctomyces sp.]|nr:hypothetical protein [Planctomyces sp.]